MKLVGTAELEDPHDLRWLQATHGTTHKALHDGDLGTYGVESSVTYGRSNIAFRPPQWNAAKTDAVTYPFSRGRGSHFWAPYRSLS